MDNRQISGALIAAAALQFLVFLVIAEALYPNYSVGANYISDLGVGGTAIIFNSSIMAFGILMVAAAYFLQMGKGDILLSLLIGIAGLSSVFVGMFPETTGMPHIMAAASSFLFGGLAAVVSSRQARVPASIIFALLGIISLAAFISAELLGTTFGLGVGGIERVVVYPLMMWGLAFGGYLMNPEKRKR